MANPLLDFINEIAGNWRSQQQLADAIGMSLSAFLRAAKNGTMSTENCLKLAQVVGENPSKVLRLARKDDVAELIEQLYGKAIVPLSDEERELLDAWKALTPRARTSFRTLMRDLSPKHEREKKRRTA